MGTILTVDHLDKSFGGKQVLHGVDFFVEEGRVVGLVGPNGAGKSTIMKAILGLIPINSGQVDIKGEPVSITKHRALRNVGALIEYPGIYPYLSGRQHLQLFAKKHNRAQNIARVVDEMGMGRYIDAKARTYSLGMKQKLGIAQALVNRPQLVILDEPMNGLDPQAVKLLRDLIRGQAANGTSFLISSHILSELEKVADDVLVLDQGRIMRSAAMADVVAAGGVTYQIIPGNLAQAQSALSLAQVDYTVVDDYLVIQDDTKAGALNHALYTLVLAGVDIRAIERKAQDLEAAFLAMTKHQTKE